jgi:hypothetical protein
MLIGISAWIVRGSHKKARAGAVAWRLPERSGSGCELGCRSAKCSSIEKYEVDPEDNLSQSSIWPIREGVRSARLLSLRP